jgi:hypothetical protein
MSRSPRTRYHRRWRVIPPPFRSAAPGIEGLAVLEEVPNGPGFALWHLLRAVNRWIATPAARREAMFAPEAGLRLRAEILSLGLDIEHEALLFDLVQVVETPGKLRADVLVRHLRRVSDWAGREQWPVTQRAFAEAAVQVTPRDAEPSVALARLLRDQGEYAAADAWYQHAVMLARQSGAWDFYVRAWIGRSKTAQRRGRMPAAWHAARKAQRAATRRGLRTLEAWALHDLFVLASAARDYRAAERYASLAARAYPKGDPYLAVLVQDMAWLWMEEGDFARAKRVLVALIPHYVTARTAHPAHLWSSLARAAGATGDEALFDQAYEAWSMLDKAMAPLEAQLDIARGALNLGRWDTAVAMASETRQTAMARGEHKAVFDSESLIEQAQTQPLSSQMPASDPVVAEDEVVGTLLSALAGAAP